MPELVVKVSESLGPRNIYIRSARGESYWGLDEALDLLVLLTAALERAADPTPLPEPAPRRTVEPPHRHILPAPKSPAKLEDIL